MVDFIEELKKVRHYQTYVPFYPERIKGYTDAEIAQIERDCNIHIHGQFRQLLRQMGRCSGGLIWGLNICMYNYIWRYEKFTRYQNSVLIDFYNDDETRNAWEQSNLHPALNKIFIWNSSGESTRCYYLITTEPDDYLWEQDEYENDMLITKTNLTILDNLREEMEWITRMYSENLDTMSVERYQTLLKNGQEDFEYYAIGRLLP